MANCPPELCGLQPLSFCSCICVFYQQGNLRNTLAGAGFLEYLGFSFIDIRDFHVWGDNSGDVGGASARDNRINIGIGHVWILCGLLVPKSF